MKKILIYIALIIPLSISAQVNLTNKQSRYLNYCIADLLEEYEYLIQTPTDRAQQEFMLLFEGEGSSHYNDLLGLSQGNELPLHEYAEALFGNAQACKVVIKEVKKGEITEDDTHYLVDVTFQKYLQYYNKCGVLFDSQDFYKADHLITATISMNKENETVKIRSVRGSIDSDAQPLPEKYKVFAYNEPRDKMVLANGEFLKYNIFDQAIVDENAKVTFNDYDVVLKLVQEDADCNLYSFKYRQRRWRVKPWVNFAIGDIYTLDGNDNYNLLKKESMMEFGVDFGYAIVAKPQYKLSLFLGFGMSNSEVELACDNELKYSYNTTSGAADADGDLYTRYYEVNNLKANLEFTQYQIPLYLDFEYQFGKRFSAYGQLGAKAYLTTKSNVTDLTADIYTYGIYSKYGNLKMENFTPNGFGASQINIPEQEIEVESMVFDAFAGLGFRVNIYKGFYFDAGVTYQHNLTPMVDNGEAVELDGRIAEDKALITFSCQEGEKVRVGTDLFEKITKGGLRANVGILFKF